MSLIVAIVIICAVGVNSQRIFPELCPTPLYPPEAGFNLTRFMGQWIEIYRFDNGTDKNDCVRSEFVKFNDSSATFSDKAKVLSDKTDVRVLGNATLEDLQLGRFTVHTEGGGADELFSVIHTDYTTYSILWSCKLTNNTSSLEKLRFLVRPTVNYKFTDAYLLALKFRLGNRFVDKDIKATVQDER